MKIYWILLVVSSVSSLSYLLSNIEKSKTIEIATQKMIFEFQKHKSMDIHFEMDTRDYDIDFMLKSILENGFESALSVSNNFKKIKRLHLIVIIKNNFLINGNFSTISQIHDFYLIITRNSSLQMIDKFFQSIWKNKQILNLNVMNENKNVIDLITFFPFSETNCNNTKNFTKINQFIDGKWINENFFPTKLKNFHNCTVNLGFVENPPASYSKNHQNGTIECSGSDINIANELSKRFNFFKNVSAYNLDHGEVLDNGTLFGLVKDLLNGNADFICGWYFMNALKVKNFAYIQPYYFVPMVIMVPKGTQYSSIENLIRSFSPELWLAFIGSILITTTVVYLINEKLPKFHSFNGNFKYHQLLVIVFGEGTSPCRNKLIRENFLRIILISFTFACLTLRAAYVSQMFNFLKSGDFKKVSSLSDMEKKNFTLYAPCYIDMYVTGLRSLYDTNLLVWLSNMEDQYNLEKHMLDVHFKGGLILPFDYVTRINKNLSYRFISQPLTYIPVVLYFRKDSFLIDSFSDKVQEMMAAGLIEYWIEKELDFRKLSQRREQKALSLEELSAPFYICISGVIISITCFLLEIFIHSYTK